MKGLVATFLIISGISYALLSYASPIKYEFDLKTLDFQPACQGSPGTYVDFVYYLDHNNEAKADLLIKSGKCGFAKEGTDAKILEEGDGWAKVLLNYDGHFYIMYMSAESLTTANQLKFEGNKLDRNNIKSFI